MKDMIEADRAAIIGRIMERLAAADDKTLREIERYVIAWTRFRRDQKVS